MFSCPCGREFPSEAGLGQHQRDKGHHGLGPAAGHSAGAGRARPSVAARRPPPPRALPRAQREAWMWKNVRAAAAVCQIHSDAVEPSEVPVSSTAGSELVCSYNWRNCRDVQFHIPGSAALWRHVSLPVSLPADKGTYFKDQNAARIPKFPFEPLFRATVSMNPSFRFDGVDVLANRNSFRKLLDFAAGRRQDSFRVNLLLEHGTLVIERCEKNARELIRGSQNAGWGRNFERAFTRYPPGLEDSAAHHRALRYQLGALSCVVRFEVDACYDGTSKREDVPGTLDLAMGSLTMADAPAETPGAARPVAPSAAPMAQETAAEMKTATKPKSLGQLLPQLWFGRTPWLIVGRHSGGTFQEVQITDAAAAFADWETRRQPDLRRLVAVLGRLRKAVEESGGGPCVALYEKTPGAPVIRVFPMAGDRKAVPDHLRRQLWDATEGGSSTAARP